MFHVGRKSTASHWLQAFHSTNPPVQRFGVTTHRDQLNLHHQHVRFQPPRGDHFQKLAQSSKIHALQKLDLQISLSLHRPDSRSTRPLATIADRPNNPPGSSHLSSSRAAKSTKRRASAWPSGETVCDEGNGRLMFLVRCGAPTPDGLGVG